MSASKDSENLLDAALAHHNEGRAVIAVTADKRPYTERWNQYFTREQSEAEVRSQFANGAYGAALILWPACPYAVLDFDGKHAREAWQTTGIELPTTARMITRSGGEHLYYRMPARPPELKRKVRIVAAGCDCVGQEAKSKPCGVDLLIHGYAVIPPTPGYREDPDHPLESIVPLPPAILGLATAHQKAFSGPTGNAQGRVSEGQRNVTACSLAGSMRARGMSIEAIRVALRTDSEQRFDPPLSETEIEGILKQAAKWSPATTAAAAPEGSQTVAPMPAPFEPEPDGRVKFPDEAWTGLFADWRDIAGECTEASLESIWAALLVALGMVVGRSAWRESPQKLFLNFYCLIVGQTGDSRKSTILWLATELLQRIGIEFKTLSGVASAEGVYEALGERVDTKALLFADEFRAMLAVGKRQSTANLIPRLNSLYYCPSRDSIDRAKNSIEIINPFVSLITATPRAYVADLLGEMEIRGGFLNRFLVIAGNEQDPKALVRAPSPAAWERVAAPLRKLADVSLGHVEMTAEAEKIWSAFYVEWRIERRQWHQQKAELTSRIFEHVLKIALAYSLMGQEKQITAESLCRAIAIGKWLQSSAVELFSDTGLDRMGQVERAIVAILKPKGKIFRRDLQQAASKKGFNAEFFNRAIKSLQANDIIELGDDYSLANRKRYTVEFIGNT